MIRFLAQNAKGAIDLLEQNDARELMGKSERAEGELVLRKRFDAVGDAGRAANYKGEMRTRRELLRGDKVCPLLGAPLFAVDG